MDILCHLCITWVHAGQPLQLVHFVVYPPNLLPNHFRPNEFHGRRLHPQVLFEGGLHWPQQMAQLCSFDPLALA